MRNRWSNFFGRNNFEEQKFEKQEFTACAQLTKRFFDEEGNFCISKTTICNGEEANDSFRQHVSQNYKQIYMCNITVLPSGEEFHNCVNPPHDLIGEDNNFENFDRN